MSRGPLIYWRIRGGLERALMLVRLALESGALRHGTEGGGHRGSGGHAPRDPGAVRGRYRQAGAAAHSIGLPITTRGPMTDQDGCGGSPEQVIEVLRDVLLEHMDSPNALPHFRVQSAVMLGRSSGRPTSGPEMFTSEDGATIITGEQTGGLRLTMRNGSEYDLWLDFPKPPEES